MTQDLTVDILIRTFNEQRTIRPLIKALNSQKTKPNKIIVVDSGSTDLTLNIIEDCSSDIEIKVVTITEFTPGKSLNIGFSHSSSDFVAVISAHCIPKNEFWLTSFLQSVSSSENIGVVYGRQLPLKYTPDTEVRDMTNLFRCEYVLQTKDSFFHNANSIIRRCLWQRFRFDESLKHIEERDFGQNLIDNNYQIMYSPDASVYHGHGINQLDIACKRASGIAKILLSREKIDSPIYLKLDSFLVSSLFVISPHSNEHAIDEYLSYLFHYLSSHEDRIVLIINRHPSYKLPHSLQSYPNILIIDDSSDCYPSPALTIDELLLACLNIIRKSFLREPDILTFSTTKYEFISLDKIDLALRNLVNFNYDSVQAAKPLSSNIWIQDELPKRVPSYRPLKDDLAPSSNSDKIVEAQPSRFSCFFTDSIFSAIPIQLLNVGFFYTI